VILDIRIPIGFLFVLIGSILFGYGLLSPPGAGRTLSGVDLNCGWGGILIAFGVGMLLLVYRRATRGRARDGAAARSAAGTRAGKPD